MTNNNNLVTMINPNAFLYINIYLIKDYTIYYFNFLSKRREENKCQSFLLAYGKLNLKYIQRKKDYIS
jgi:hypothetical protein